jgi:uncharacterized protein
MATFEFDKSHLLGKVRDVDTRKVSILVENSEDLRKARVGQLVAINLPGAIEAWLIGLIERVIKTIARVDETIDLEGETYEVEPVANIVKVTLLGSLTSLPEKTEFSRSLNQVPEIDSNCNILRDAQLETFMGILSQSGKRGNSFEIGKYTIDEKAKAYIDGNKFFQRHAALVGSTGSGKSWTVASILEKASQLPSANMVVFDLHGEYAKLNYAKQLRIPGPEDLGKSSEELLYLPYWLLNAEEMQTMFVDKSEFTAHNQVMAFQDSVIEQKKLRLSELDKKQVLAAFTIDSPVPFNLGNVIANLRALNEEMEQGARGLKQGPFHGQFSRLLTRIRSKLSDKRYGFLFQAPDTEHQYETMAKLANKLMDFSETESKIKVIDFSEVPEDILPIMVGLVARLIYQVQFWTEQEKRHPLVFVCDEAHLYLPKKEGQNPVERRAIENFEKIAKEGRKYGVALFVVSQRPSDVSETILSQCNNVISLRLTNINDQSTVRKLMPESLESMLEVLPIMDIGEGMVVGDAVLLPSRIRINPPKEKPISSTIDFWSEWSKKTDSPDFIKIVENYRRQSRD